MAIKEDDTICSGNLIDKYKVPKNRLPDLKIQKEEALKNGMVIHWTTLNNKSLLVTVRERIYPYGKTKEISSS